MKLRLMKFLRRHGGIGNGLFVLVSFTDHIYQSSLMAENVGDIFIYVVTTNMT